MSYRKKIKSLQITKSERWEDERDELDSLKSSSQDTGDAMLDRALENKARDLGVPVQELRDWNHELETIRPITSSYSPVTPQSYNAFSFDENDLRLRRNSLSPSVRSSLATGEGTATSHSTSTGEFAAQDYMNVSDRNYSPKDKPMPPSEMTRGNLFAHSAANRNFYSQSRDREGPDTPAVSQIKNQKQNQRDAFRNVHSEQTITQQKQKGPYQYVFEYL